METNYQKLKEVIWKAHPSILDLKFGCEGIGYFPYGTGDHTLTRFIKGVSYWQKKDDGFQGTVQITQILGRPIRLADVLLTAGKHNSTKEQLTNIVFRWYWDMDNLDHQSDETRQFLIDLLVK